MFVAFYFWAIYKKQCISIEKSVVICYNEEDNSFEENRMLFYIMMSALTDDDRTFVEKIYEKYGSFMYKTAYDVLKSKEDAEDAVNDAMCKIIKYLAKFEKSANENVCNMVTICIRNIVRNKAIDLYNKNKKSSGIRSDFYVRDDETGEYRERDFADESIDLEDIVIKNEERDTVRKALSELSSDLKDAVNLVYMCGYTSIEAADFLGISNSAIRVRLFEARRKLKKYLGKELRNNG